MCYYVGIAENSQESIEAASNARWSLGREDFPAFDMVSAMASPELPVITMEAPGNIQPFHWRLSPSWMHSTTQLKKSTIWSANIRVEEAEEKKGFVDLIEGRRCVLCITHFFEWRHEGKHKIKHRVFLENGHPLIIPGLYSHTVIDGKPWNSFGLCTMDARHIMRHIHNSALRQALVIPTQAIQIWLDPALSFVEARKQVLEQERSAEFASIPPGPFHEEQELF